MPRSNAWRIRSSPVSRSLLPHQLVPTVQTPKPTSETVMPVLPISLYFIVLPLNAEFFGVEAHRLTPGAVRRRHDLAAATPEDVGVANRNAERREMDVNRRLVLDDEVLVEPVRHRHHVDVAELSPAFAPVSVGEDMMPGDLASGFDFSALRHLP